MYVCQCALKRVYWRGTSGHPGTKSRPLEAAWGSPKADTVREVAWIYSYRSSKNADKGGGEGVQNPENFADVLYVWSLSRGYHPILLELMINYSLLHLSSSREQSGSLTNDPSLACGRVLTVAR